MVMMTGYEKRDGGGRGLQFTLTTIKNNDADDSINDKLFVMMVFGLTLMGRV